ncbi:hypothetical protein AB0395_45935 [Streptosporangium sp. NPDC051023]|uniref:hypothetical protein n=1 Tax=Streptosporangium sp. NPDC051023 TaxID=3155410 RepID=UPI00344D34BB
MSTEPGVVRNLARHLAESAPGEILALSFLDEFDLVTAQTLTRHVFRTDVTIEGEWWASVFERRGARWITRPFLRPPLRRSLMENDPETVRFVCAGMVDLSIGDQLSDPFSLSMWFSRFGTQPLGRSSLFALALEEPRLAYESLELLRRNEESFVYRAAFARLKNASESWADVFRMVAERSPALKRVYYDNILLVLGHTPPRPRARPKAGPGERVAGRTVRGGGLELRLDAAYQWEYVVLKDTPKGPYEPRLIWPAASSPALLTGPVAVPLPAGVQGALEGAAGDDSRAPRRQEASRWREEGSRRTFRESEPDIGDLLVTSLFPRGEVERAIHKISIVNDYHIERELLLTLRPPTVREGEDSPHYIVLWQIPDSAAKAPDLQRIGADGFPIFGPSSGAASTLKERLNEVLDRRAGGPGSEPPLITAAVYVQLDRLRAQPWRIIRAPQSRAESQVSVQWSEEIRLSQRWTLLRALRGNVVISVQTSGFTIEEDFQVTVSTPQDLQVHALELGVPQRSERLDIPSVFTDSTLVVKLRLSRTTRLYLQLTPLLLGVVLGVVAVAAASPVNADFALQLVYLPFTVVPIVVSTVIEMRRQRTHQGGRAFRYLPPFFVALWSITTTLVLTVLLPFDSYWHMTAQVAAGSYGALLIAGSGFIAIMAGGVPSFFRSRADSSGE